MPQSLLVVGRGQRRICLLLFLCTCVVSVAAVNGEPPSSDTTPSTTTVRITLEGTVPPLYRCPSCRDSVRQEQAAIATAVRRLWPDNAVVVAQTTYRLLNLLFVEVRMTRKDDDECDETTNNNNNIADMHTALRALPGVKNVYAGEHWEGGAQLDINLDVDDNGYDDNENVSIPLAHIGADPATLCVTGRGVTVAILDSGVDYTHVRLGGPGTLEAYHAAYDNNNGNGSFSTTTVITDGADFLGDDFRDGDLPTDARPDGNPIDSSSSGHGTAVADAVRTVAPDVSLVAVKVCTTRGQTCPDFAYIQALEYVVSLNANPDDDNISNATNRKVDIVNVSLGRLFLSPYHSVLAKATEEVFALGILPVVAAGNHGNIPFVLGGAPATPNALTVGATTVVQKQQSSDTIDSTTTTTRTTASHMASYSSRGPSHGLKPDLVAPGGPFALAQAGTGDGLRRRQGTSFAAPLVAGAAALVRQQCGPDCAPLAIQALLMNHAVRVTAKAVPLSTTMSNNDDDDVDTEDSNDTKTVTNAPASWQGSGELRVDRSLAATFWVVSDEDGRPSISLGTITAAQDVAVTRHVRIVSLSDVPDTLTVDYEFRRPTDAVTIQISQRTIAWDGRCPTETIVELQFHIDARRAPSNHMVSGGVAGHTAEEGLDLNEVDGWITVTSAQSASTPVGLAFHVILRKASAVDMVKEKASTEAGASKARRWNEQTSTIPVHLHNQGTEIAQIDAYQLLHVSEDNPEQTYGVADPPSDLRYVGYRIVPSDIPDCPSVLEFAVHTWESQLSLAYTHFDLWFDLDGDGEAEHRVYNAGYRLGSLYSEMRRYNLISKQEFCVGFAPDHTTESANTVLRVCSHDIGLADQTTVDVAVTSYSFPDNAVADRMSYQTISIDQAAVSAHSYDIDPGAILSNVAVEVSGTSPNGSAPLGLLLFTNAYRSPARTGAATRASEAVVLWNDGGAATAFNTFGSILETTPDVLQFPVAQDRRGPDCLWATAVSQCSASRRSLKNDALSLPDPDPATRTSRRQRQHLSSASVVEERNSEPRTARDLQSNACVEYNIPRSTNVIVVPVIDDRWPAAQEASSAPTPSLSRTKDPLGSVVSFHDSDDAGSKPTLTPSEQTMELGGMSSRATSRINWRTLLSTAISFLLLHHQ